MSTKPSKPLPPKAEYMKAYRIVRGKQDTLPVGIDVLGMILALNETKTPAGHIRKLLIEEFGSERIVDAIQYRFDHGELAGPGSGNRLTAAIFAVKGEGEE